MAPAPVLVTQFVRRSEASPVLRAALGVDIVYVPLAAPPDCGRCTLQLWVGNELLISLAAELVGSGRNGSYPLRVRPLDPAHVPALEALIEYAEPISKERQSVGASPKPKRLRGDGTGESVLPSPRSFSPPYGVEQTLLSRGIVPPNAPMGDATIPAPPPAEAEWPSAELEAAFAGPRLPREFPIDAHDLAERGAAELLASPHDTSPGASPALGDAAFETNPAEVTADPPAIRPRMISVSDEMTLPGESSRSPMPVQWNVRSSQQDKDPLCGRPIGGGKYVLESVIGSGAIGIVFKSSHRDLGRTVAIKVLNPRYRDDPELMQTVRSEARAASLLEHPNIARVYDYGVEPDGLVYIVMEYLSGYTLNSVLGARRRLTRGRAIDIMMQVCAALSAAHDRGIVHRDVKPDNVVIVPAQDDEGRPVEVVKVCDFGIAALGTATLAAGSLAGTPEYMAPEQITGGTLTPAADVYACGVVLYEMLTGEAPFRADQPYRVLIKHAHEPPRPPSQLVQGLPPGLEAAILKALEKAPARRFQSAREMRVELRNYAEAR